MTASEQLQIVFHKLAAEATVSPTPKALPTGMPPAGQAPTNSAKPKKAPVKKESIVERLLKPGAGAGMDGTIRKPSGIAGARA